MWFLIKEGISGFRTARMPVFLSILAITISLFFNGIFFLTFSKVNEIARSLKKEFAIQFFIDPASKIRTEPLVKKFQSENVVSSVVYISPDSALKEMSISLDIPLEFIIDRNPLPPTLKVYIKSKYVQEHFINNFLKKYKNSPDFIDIQYPKNKLALMEKYGMAILLILISVGLLFLVSSVLLIIYTLKITIHGKQNFIVLTRLMGGTSFYIRFPFFIEALLEGFFAVSISSSLLWVFEKFLLNFRIITQPFNIALYVFILITGLLVGMVGSQIALKKYLLIDEELL